MRQISALAMTGPSSSHFSLISPSLAEFLVIFKDLTMFGGFQLKHRQFTAKSNETSLGLSSSGLEKIMIF